MKAPNPDNDRQLSQLLHEWNPKSSLPPRFQERVWNAIDRAEARKPEGALVMFTRWVEAVFRRPAFATVYVAVLLFVGLGAGYLQAQDKTAQTESKMRALYVQSVDPYLAARN
ncbi:MAG: hypothetical protein U1F83_03625 [Verrucomicrobiota bacterium]|jgi:hypothetical protein